jgi:hypothetical protein
MYRSISPLCASAALLDASSSLFEISTRRGCRKSRLELLIGNERWLSPSTFVPAFSHRRDLGERGCVLCVDAEIDVDALESAFTFCIQVEGYPRL